MTPRSDQKALVLVGLLILALAVAGVWSYGKLCTGHRAVATSASDLATCRRLAAKMRSLNGRPAVASDRQIQLNELTSHIEQSTQNAKIAPDSLVRIWPDAPTRLGDTPYQKKATQVLFHKVTLRQIITFLHHVAAQEGGPQATRVRLVAPRGAESDNVWTVETTLTYLIYAPKIRAAS